MNLENYEFLEEEINDEMKDDLEDTLNLKESLELAREELLKQKEKEEE